MARNRPQIYRIPQDGSALVVTPNIDPRYLYVVNGALAQLTITIDTGDLYRIAAGTAMGFPLPDTSNLVFQLAGASVFSAGSVTAYLFDYIPVGLYPQDMNEQLGAAPNATTTVQTTTAATATALVPTRPTRLQAIVLNEDAANGVRIAPAGQIPGAGVGLKLPPGQSVPIRDGLAWQVFPLAGTPIVSVYETWF